jgi:hypothetical protein
VRSSATQLATMKPLFLSLGRFPLILGACLTDHMEKMEDIKEKSEVEEELPGLENVEPSRNVDQPANYISSCRLVFK